MISIKRFYVSTTRTEYYFRRNCVHIILFRMCRKPRKLLTKKGTGTWNPMSVWSPEQEGVYTESSPKIG